jgi:hypothetical protein
MVSNMTLDLGQVPASKAVIRNQADGIEPEFRLVFRRLDMDVRRLDSFVAEKEETKSADS